MINTRTNKQKTKRVLKNFLTKNLLLLTPTGKHQEHLLLGFEG